MTYDIERHVTIYHDWEIGSDLLPVSLQELYILLQTNMSIGRTVRQGNLSTPEAQLLGNFGFGTGEV